MTPGAPGVSDASCAQSPRHGKPVTNASAPCMMGQERHKERYRRMCIAMGTGKIKWDKLNAAQPFKFYPPIVEQSCR
jgi:hypothetical protein